MSDTRRPFPNHVELERQEPGSILFFAPHLGTGNETDIKQLGPTQEQRLFRSLFSLIPGHSEGLNFMFHNAVVMHKADGEPHIAHITEKENHLGYVQETLREQIARDNDRAFIAFNPNGAALFEKVRAYFGNEFCRHNQLTPDTVKNVFGRVVGQCVDSTLHPKLERITWTYKAGLAAVFNTVTLKENRKITPSQIKMQDTSSVCSEFCVKALKIGAINYFEALYRLAQSQLKRGIIKQAGNVDQNVNWNQLTINADNIPGYVHIKSNATPKEFYHHLYQHSDYQMSCYLGKKPIERTVQCLKLILSNVSNVTGSNETETEEKARYLGLDILDEFWENAQRPATKQARNERQQLIDLFEALDTNIMHKVHPAMREKILDIMQGLTFDIAHLHANNRQPKW